MTYLAEMADAIECAATLKALKFALSNALTPGGCESDRIRFDLTKREIATLMALVDEALGID